jgi:GNAT superfamily N-acetyltransferase
LVYLLHSFVYRSRDYNNTNLDTAITISTDQQKQQQQHHNTKIFDNNEIIVWKIRPCENPTRVQMLHWYICGIIDRILHYYRWWFMNHDTTTAPSPQYFMPSTKTRQRFSLLLNFDASRRHMEHQNHQMVVILATIPSIPLTKPHDPTVIGRFGIVTEPGPIVPQPLKEVVNRIYYSNSSISSSTMNLWLDTNTKDIRAGAIVYMFVEQEYRGLNIGDMALKVIHTIQRSCQCTYTILVANDKTPTREHRTNPRSDSDTTTAAGRYDDMKLVQWYRRNGYHVAEEIQEMLGSPNGIYGIAMIKSLYHDDNRNYTVPIIQWW